MSVTSKNGRYFLVGIIIVAILALLFGLWVHHNFGNRIKNPADLNLAKATVLPQPKNLTPFQLTTDNKQVFTNNNLKGHWSLLFFGFTNCPELCPTTLATLNKMYQILQHDKQNPMPQVVFISVDPKRDTPQKIADYLLGFNKNFIGTTGNQQQLDQLTQELNVMYAKIMANSTDQNYSVDHSGTILMTNPQGQLYAVFTTPHDPQALAQDVRVIISSAG